MRVLFDIMHPAQAHFFKHLIWLLQREGHAVLITARQKDVTTDLLDAFGMEYVCLSRRRAGLIGMGRELLERYVRLLRVARRFRPDVLVEQAGVSIGPVGAVLGIPRVVLENAEHAWLQQLLGLPFATQIFTDSPYLKDFGRRHKRFRGIWVQSYLAPQYFQPDAQKLRPFGVGPNQSYIVLRTVSWAAAHDIGLHGSSESDVGAVADRLSRFGRVLISSEDPLPESLGAYRNPVPVQYMHDLLAYASLYIGEGGTMAAEAAVLGTPAVFCNPLRTGNLLVLEKQYGLLYNTNSLLEGVGIAEELLRQDGLRQRWQEKRGALLDDSDDIVRFMYRLVMDVGAGGKGRQVRHGQ
jgi:predicted glycosyltransferase